MNEDEEPVRNSAYTLDDEQTYQEEVVPFVTLANNQSTEEELVGLVQKRRLSDVAAETLN